MGELPASFTPDDVSAAITAQANARQEARLERTQARFAYFLVPIRWE
ncbi:hypothetical protein HEP87_42970 [Streptomyces sp. S1D4-11]|nr:hypothetical protein [Streptomyces sp. S1D4-11]QIY99446.1 hypothetical protein HEP87_42970 [Streptomyces sp. S1D4-11]